MRRLIALALGALVVAGGVLALVSGLGSDSPRAPRGRAAFRPAPAPAERPVPRAAGVFLTARVRATAQLRAIPGGRPIARIRTRTEYGSPRILSVVARRAGWLGVAVPERADGRLAWISASRVDVGRVGTALRVDLSARRLEVWRGRRRLRAVRVAVGRPGAQTPIGRFAVTDTLRIVDPASPYGCCAIALSARQPRVPSGWPGGDRIAIHGTLALTSIGQAVSLGCLRTTNAAMRRLMREVPLGAPVFVRA